MFLLFRIFVIQFINCHSQVQVCQGDPDNHGHAVRQQLHLIPTQGQGRPRGHGASELLPARRRPHHTDERV